MCQPDDLNNRRSRMEALLTAHQWPLLAVLALAGSFGVFTGRIAELKGYSANGGWAVAGLLLGPIALIAAAGLPDLTTRKLLREYLDRLP